MDKPTEIKAGQIWAISDIRYYLLIEKDKHSQKGEWRAYGWDDHGSCLALVYEFELGESLEYFGEYNPAGNAELSRQNAVMRAALERVMIKGKLYYIPKTKEISCRAGYENEITAKGKGQGYSQALDECQEIAGNALQAVRKDGE